MSRRKRTRRDRRAPQPWEHEDEHKALIGLYRSRRETELARALKLSSSRRVRQWLSGERGIPAGVWSDLDALVRKRRAELSRIT